MASYKVFHSVFSSDGSLFRVDVMLNEGVSVLEWRLHDDLDDDAEYGFKYKPGGSKIEINLKKATKKKLTDFRRRIFD